MIWDFWSNPNSLLFSNSLNLSYIYMCIKNSHAFAIPSLLSLLMCSSWDVLGRDGINVDPPAFYTNGSTFTALCVCICIYSYIHPGEGNGNPLQYSCLENSMGRGTWWATVRGVTQLDMTEQLSTHAFIFIISFWGLPRWLSGKESPCQSRRCRFDPWVRKISWRRKWQPTPVFLPGESPGQRSLAGYSPWGHKESDTTEQWSTYAL